MAEQFKNSLSTLKTEFRERRRELQTNLLDNVASKTEKIDEKMNDINTKLDFIISQKLWITSKEEENAIPFLPATSKEEYRSMMKVRQRLSSKYSANADSRKFIG